MHVIDPLWLWQDCKYDTKKKFAFKLDNSHIINLFTPRAETKAESINTTPITMKLTLQVINQMKVIE